MEKGVKLWLTNLKQNVIIMIRLFIILLVILTACATPKDCCSQTFKKAFKFSTFYVAANGGTSLADRDVYFTSQGVLPSY